MNSAPWWVAVAAVTAVAALGGTAITTWRQNRRAGREEWFRRVRWAETVDAIDFVEDPEGDNPMETP